MEVQPLLPDSESERSASLKVADSLKHKPHLVPGHQAHHHTANRKARAELESLALAEAFGSWLSSFTGREVRGSEGLFEDLQDGVVLCHMLMRLGIDVHKPRDPVRNAFEARENRQKFQSACVKAGFKSIPSVDVGDKILSTLLEAAAVCNAQNLKRDRDEAAGQFVTSHRRRASSMLPAALTKRLGEVHESKVVSAAVAGELTPVFDEDNVAAAEAPSEAQPVSTLPPPPYDEERPAAVLQPVPVVVAQPKEMKAKNSPLLAAARKRVDSGPTNKERARSVSEIPAEEKDRMVNQCMLIMAALVVVWFLFLR